MMFNSRSGAVGPSNSRQASSTVPLKGTPARRSPIPRPWLTEHHYVSQGHQHPHHHPHQGYRYMPPPMGSSYQHPYAVSRSNTSMELLQRPDWKMSWSKLSCCFCTKSTTKQMRKESGTGGGRNNTPLNGQDVHRRRSYNDNVPFPAFPILRRNSSSDQLVSENEIYPSSGSVSSFTDSDTSHSQDSNHLSTHPPLGSRQNRHNRHHTITNASHVRANDTFDSEELRHHPESPIRRPSTPPPEAVMPRPPILTNRSQSAALPITTSTALKNPSISSSTTPGTNSINHAWVPSSGRARMDTDFTRHSGTSNTSRHRRRVPYEFSDRSIDQIWQGNSAQTISEENKPLVLPSYVVLMPSSQNNPPPTAATSNNSVFEGSGYVSAMDDSGTDWGTTSENYDGDNDDGEEMPVSSATNAAPSTQQQSSRKPQQAADGTGRRPSRESTTERPPKAISGFRRDQTAKLPPKRPTRRSVPVMVPTYLRKSVLFDNEARGSLVASGWLAASIGGQSLEERFFSETTKGILGVRDIWYLQLIVGRNGRARMDLRSSGGKVEHEIWLQRDWICESREISSRIGRYVNIRSRSSLKTITSLLPVSLEDCFFSGEKLLAAQQFAKVHDRMFVAGKGKVYAPDEQHDAAMYIMFSLDTLIKSYPA